MKKKDARGADFMRTNKSIIWILALFLLILPAVHAVIYTEYTSSGLADVDAFGWDSTNKKIMGEQSWLYVGGTNRVPLNIEFLLSQVLTGGNANAEITIYKCALNQPSCGNVTGAPIARVVFDATTIGSKNLTFTTTSPFQTNNWYHVMVMNASTNLNPTPGSNTFSYVNVSTASTVANANMVRDTNYSGFNTNTGGDLYGILHTTDISAYLAFVGNSSPSNNSILNTTSIQINQTINSSFAVNTSAPIIQNIYLTGSYGSDLNAFFNTTNPTGLGIINITDWRINGTSIVLVNLPFDGGSNTTFTKDYSSYGRNATVVGVAWCSNCGITGGAYQFNGALNTAQYINTSVSASNISWSYVWYMNWINKSSGVIFNSGTTNSGRNGTIVRHSAVTPENMVVCITNDSAVENCPLTIPMAYSNTLQMIVVTYNQSLGNVSAYVNGTLVQSRQIQNYSVADTSRFTIIGARNFTGLNVFNGTIDNFQIYNRVLSQQEISYLYFNKTTLMAATELSSSVENWSACITLNDGGQEGNTLCSSSSFSNGNVKVSTWIGGILAFLANMFTGIQNFVFNTTLNSGNYNYTVNATDSSGNSVQTSNNLFTINTAANVQGFLYPLNNTQWNNTPTISQYILAPVAGNATTYLDGIAINVTLYQMGFTNITYIPSLTQGQHTIFMNLTSGDGGSRITNTSIIYYDTINPTAQTNFQNNSFYYRDNITGQFNFTDTQLISSYNVTLDNVQIDGANGLSSALVQYNLSHSVLGLGVGTHVLGVRFADGHTANKIEEYTVDDGLLFHDKITYEFNDNNEISLQAKDGSIFDTFTTEKSFDRYSFTYEPSKKRDTVTFTISSTDKLYLIERPDLSYKKWLVTESKWIDFVGSGDASIKMIDDYHAEATINDLEDEKKLSFHSIGDLNIVQQNYTFYTLSATTTAPTFAVQGALNPLTLVLNTTNITNYPTSANLVWQGINEGQGTQTNTTTSNFINSFIAPAGLSSLINYQWNFSVNGFPFNINGTQTYINFNITNCTAPNYVVLNLTLYDEASRVRLNTSNMSIKSDMSFVSDSNASNIFNFSVTSTSNELLICLGNNTLSRNFDINGVVEYRADSYSTEYHYLQNVNLSSTNIPNIIPLYDLPTADSTSFLISWQDQNYLYVENAIIDVIRKYVGINQSLSVENGKTDQNGQTVVHLVSENVIYRFDIYQNRILVYSTPEYRALCQTTPCQINLKKIVSDNSTISQIANLAYSFAPLTGNVITFNYGTVDGASTVINMTVIRQNAYSNNTICSSQATSSGGTLTCPVPASTSAKVAGNFNLNSTFYALIFKDGKYIGFGSFDNAPVPNTTQTGIVLTVFAYLALAGIFASTSPIAIIVFGMIGLVLMTLVNVFAGGGFFAIGSGMMWLFVAASIIIWKLNQGRY